MTISFEAQKGLFILSTAHTAYCFYLLPGGQLVHSYWGSKLAGPGDYPALLTRHQHAAHHAFNHHLHGEFPVPDGIQEVEPGLKTVFSDGTRDLRLAYLSHQISEDETKLTITLKDQFYPLELLLHYELYPEYDLLRRRVEVVNSGQSGVKLEQVLSASVGLPFDRGNFRLTHLAGAHLLETQLEQGPVSTGRKVLESRQLHTGHSFNPFFALDLLDDRGLGATETSGEIWYGALAWSGNWKIVVEQTRSPYRVTRVAAGINDYDFSWQLEAGERFATPWLVLGYTESGFGQMSRNLHRYQLAHVLPTAAAHALRPVLYNSWEAVEFAVNEAEQLKLAQKAARLGVELFVVDDGWFGERHSDKAGLGDWTTNAQKFPAGLTPLIKGVNALGMDFGLWVEPEMVNPDSELYRAHPEWVYHFANRPYTSSRNQLILNLARSDVQEYLYAVLDKLLTAHNISYIKWDFNRSTSEPGWPDAPLEKQREVWVRHVQAFYTLVDELRARHPGVLWEACAGGGGRADLGTLFHFDHLWASDNTDPFDRLSIQQGYTLAYAPKTMYGWVTQSNHNRADYSLSYRFHSAAWGSLGIGANLNSWNEAELAQATRLIEQYKQMRPIIQNGLFYRLTSLGLYDRLALQFHAAKAEEGVVLAFNRRKNFWQERENPRIRLTGLAPASSYELEGELTAGEPKVWSGQALMSRGILPHFQAHFDSVMVHYRRVLP